MARWMVRTLMVIMLTCCAVLSTSSPSLAAGDRSTVEAVLADTARGAGWPPGTFRSAGSPRGAVAISASGRDEDVDKVMVLYDDSDAADDMWELLETNGIPRDSFHGKPALRIRNGKSICEAGGTVGWILRALRLIVTTFAPDADTSMLCVQATGTVAWRCGSTMFVVNSPDADDNSVQLADLVYQRAELRGLCSREVAWSRVAAKLAKGQRLNSCEFLVFVQKIEQLNADMGWQQIATAMHQGIYAADTHLSFGGVDLFVNGPENAGWEKVIIPYGSQKFIESTGVTVIDMGHAYAGLRAVINRNRASSWFMSRINTEWGDQTQVIQEKVEGTAGRIWGNVRWLKNQLPFVGTDEGVRDANAYINASKKQSDNAASFLPKDQQVGNAGGLFLRSWFISNPKGKLSDAYRAWFTSLKEKC